MVGCNSTGNTWWRSYWALGHSWWTGCRWCDPATSQFTSIDALVALTDQPYSYAGGDPMNGSDPSGLCPGPAYPVSGFATLFLSSWYSPSYIDHGSEFLKLTAFNQTVWVYRPVYLWYEATLAPSCSGWWFLRSCTNVWSGMSEQAATNYVAMNVEDAMFIEASSLWGSWQRYLSHTTIGVWLDNVSANDIPFYLINDGTIKWLLYQLQFVDQVGNAISWVSLAQDIAGLTDLGWWIVKAIDEVF